MWQPLSGPWLGESEPGRVLVRKYPLIHAGSVNLKWFVDETLSKHHARLMEGKARFVPWTFLTFGIRDNQRNVGFGNPSLGSGVAGSVSLAV